MALVDYFLKLDGITGESQDSKHKGEIQLESWSWGEQNSGTFSTNLGGGAGKVQMGDFSFVKQIDQSDTSLAQACATGQHIKSAILTCRKAGGTQLEYLIFKFTDCLVSGYQISGAATGEVLPTTQISINFTTIAETYVSQKPDGTAGPKFSWGYDLKQQTAVAAA